MPLPECFDKSPKQELNDSFSISKLFIDAYDKGAIKAIEEHPREAVVMAFVAGATVAYLSKGRTVSFFKTLAEKEGGQLATGRVTASELRGALKSAATESTKSHFVPFEAAGYRHVPPHLAVKSPFAPFEAASYKHVPPHLPVKSPFAPFEAASYKHVPPHLPVKSPFAPFEAAGYRHVPPHLPRSTQAMVDAAGKKIDPTDLIKRQALGHFDKKSPVTALKTGAGIAEGLGAKLAKNGGASLSPIVVRISER